MMQRYPYRFLRHRATVCLALTAALGLLGLAIPGCDILFGNRAPVAQDQDASAGADTTTTVTLAATDANAGDVLTFIIISLPANGTLSDPGSGDIDTVPHTLAGDTVDYTPGAGYTGPDEFDFMANDGAADSNEATVSLSVGEDVPTNTISEDTTVPTLNIPAGETTAVKNHAVITVTGDATIDGSLAATDSRITLVVAGDLTVNGTLRSTDTTTDGLAEGTPLNQQPAGIHLIVGAGAATFSATAILETTRNIVLSDDREVLASPPDEFFDEIEDVNTDGLPTLVPLPPDDDVFNEPAPKVGGRTLRTLADPPITVGGTWPPAGAPAPRGDKPVIIFRFKGDRELILENLTINGPGAPPGQDGDETDDPGNDAQGKSGKNGMRLNIWNNGGPITVNKSVVLNLADGGDGGSATAECASATGGPGGNSGNFRMTAAGGIDITKGTLTINPGRSGNGGDATVNLGPPGADGCPGEDGRDATATAGDGADNTKRLYARGNVTGLENVTIGDLNAGNGGNATAEACDGGNGIACCDGGSGGDAEATGGNGGDASLSVGALPVSVGLVNGGDGGDANAVAGNGGNGGDCKFFDGGDGGDSGAATGTGGDGGNATGGALAFAGDAGDASADGGFAGDGGDSGFGTPGSGGIGMPADATAGSPGVGDADGLAGEETPLDGLDGDDGTQMGVLLYCFPLAFIQVAEGVFPPGTFEGPVFDEDGVTQLGTMSLDFPDIAGANYQRGDNPVPHIGVGNSFFDIHVSTLDGEVRTDGIVGGLRIAPLSGFGIDETNPLVVEALDANQEVIDSRQFGVIPDNTLNSDNPETIEALFDVGVSVSTFRIVLPEGTFVTIIRIYLLDP